MPKLPLKALPKKHEKHRLIETTISALMLFLLGNTYPDHHFNCAVRTLIAVFKVVI